MLSSERRPKHAGAPASGALNGETLRPTAADPADLTATAAWSRRVRWIGGLIQAAFAAFWLVRGSRAIGGDAADVLIALSGVAAIGVFAYAVLAASGTAPRPKSPEGRRIERAVTIATLLELAAAIVLPILVSAAGHSDWVLPSIAITIGPLLLWLDHSVHVPRYRPVGWALTIGPLVLVGAISGSVLVATTGLAAGALLLATAIAGFADLAGIRRRAEQVKDGSAVVPAAAGVPL